MIQPTQIIEEPGDRLTIEWSDGTATTYDAVGLRRACPCAGCVDEWTGKKMLDDMKIPEDLSLGHISIVGRYALNFHFSDGHETGIFSFNYLRKLSEPAEPPAGGSEPPAVAGG